MNLQSKKVAVTYSIDRKILQEFQAWLDRQSIKPSKTAVVEAALREFLQRQEAMTGKKPRETRTRRP